MKSTDGRSGGQLPDRAGQQPIKNNDIKALEQNKLCLGTRIYLDSSVALRYNSMSSVSQQVGKNQEVISIFSLLIGQLKTT